MRGRAPTAAAARSGTVALDDGRQLAFAEYGDGRGRPVVYCHGMPGSRLQAAAGESAVASAGVRLIVPDRPGHGLSHFQPRRRLLDWPRDVCALADALSIERFAVVGVSGGGPHALACAYVVPERLIGIATVSSPAPLDRRGALQGWGRYASLGLRVARLSPALFYLILSRFGDPRHNPEDFWTGNTAALPPSDRRLLSRPEIASALVADTREALRQGLRGYWWDLVLLARSWGFPPSRIAMPVHLWHGDADTVVPISMARTLCRAIPTCHAHFLPLQGHFLVFDHLGAILAAALGHGQAKADE